MFLKEDKRGHSAQVFYLFYTQYVLPCCTCDRSLNDIHHPQRTKINPKKYWMNPEMQCLIALAGHSGAPACLEQEMCNWLSRPIGNHRNKVKD